MTSDIRYALRTLVRDRGFSAVVIVSLALAIGLSTSVFTIVNSFLLRPMPVQQPERLVALYSVTRDRSLPGNFSWPDLEELRKETKVFAAVFGHSQRSVRLQVDEDPELAMAETVTGNYFTGLEAQPAAGRLFAIENDQALNQAREVVLSYGYWLRRFQGDRRVVGRSIRINDQPMTIVGVGPRGLSGTQMLTFLPDVWIPVSMQSISYPDDRDLLERRASQWFTLRARLQPGVTLKQARDAVSLMARRWNETWPEAHKTTHVDLASAPGKFHAIFHTRGFINTAEMLMFGVIGLILLLACANVASLMLARGSARAKELAVRASLGARRGRLLRQLLSESMILGLLSGMLGLGLAVWLTTLQMQVLPPVEFTVFDENEIAWIDGRVAAFTAIVSLLAALVFGTWPAWRASGARPADALRSTRGESSGPSRIRAVLVVVQVALCCVLLTIAGLFVRSLLASQQLDPGFQTSRLLTGSFDLNLQGYDVSRGRELHRRVLELLRASPGIEAASIGFILPLDAYTSGDNIVINNAAGPAPGGTLPFAFNGIAGPGYFDVLQTPIVAGRAIDERDVADAPFTAVINQAMASRFWPGQDPLGRSFHLAGDAARRQLRVIGVARNGKYITIGEGETPFFWLPVAQHHAGRLRVMVRTAGRPELATAALREAFRKIDPALPLYGIQTGRQFLSRPLSGGAIIAMISSMFGLAALLLATVGLYGTMQYNQSRRRHEMGIRAAMGATAVDMAKLIAGSGLRLTLAGAALGLAAAYGGSKLLAALLVGVDPRDPWTFAGVVLVELLAAVAACLTPALRAARVSPADALRAE